MLLRDQIVLLVVQLALATLLLTAVLVQAWKAIQRGMQSRRIAQPGTMTATLELTVIRGDRSINFLYAFYGITTVVYTLIVQVADAAVGHKAAIIAADYLALTYLCFFNSWFRNKLVGFYNRIQKD